MKKNPVIILIWGVVCALFYFPLLSFLKDGVLTGPDELGNLSYWKIIGTTVLYSLLTSIICAVISTPVAIRISFNKGPLTDVIRSVAFIPFLINPLVIILGWIVLLRDHGFITDLLRFAGGGSILYTPGAVIIGMVYLGIPVMVFFLSSRMKNTESNLFYAAALMGATRNQVFWRVLFPQIIQGYGYGCLVVFLSSCGFFIIPALLGGGQIVFVSTLIDQLVNRSLDWSRAARLSLMLLGAISFVVAFFVFLLKSYSKSLE